MVRVIYAAVFILVFVPDVRSQFFDFISAFQPVHSTNRPYYGFTTRRQKIQTKDSRNDRIDSIKVGERQDLDRDKQNQKIGDILFGFYTTTTKPIRKTTKPPTTVQHSREPSGANKSKAKPPNKTNHRDVNVTGIDISKIKYLDRNPGFQHSRDRPQLDTENNSILQYQMARPNFYDNKKYYSTQAPFTSRPGVRPAAVHGPPITNKPPQKTNYEIVHQDNSVSPELIIGPNEDYMTAVEKKRHIEMAEKMCDKYKAMDVKQIAAIPLVPSPDLIKINVSSCSPSTIPLVVGGKVVTIREFPHMALLGWNRVQNDGYEWKCGGSVISKQHVLTAAHCAYQDRDDGVVTGAPRAVQLGSSFLNDPGATVVKVAAVIRHPKYKQPKSYFDIALVKLATTITFSDVIKPACLGVPPEPGNPVIATGWGRTEFKGDQSEELRSVSVSVWDMDECFNVLGTSRKLPNGPSSESQVCAGEKKGGKDTCQGDSGGPAQVQSGCIWRVVAVTSLGRSCGAPQTPAIYAKVQRAFVAAVAFGGQESAMKDTTNQPSNQNENKPTVWNTNSNTNPNNQWNIQQNNQHQQTGWNSQPVNRPGRINNQPTRTTEPTFQWNNNGNPSNGNIYNQNVFNQNTRDHYNSYTTKKPSNQNGYYNDYGGSSDQRDQSYYSDGRVWWA